MAAYPPFTYEDFAQDGTRGYRREKRRDVRTALGVSSDPAPTITAALSAARHLDELLRAAGNNRFTLEIRDRRTGEYIPPAQAIARARLEKEG